MEIQQHDDVVVEVAGNLDKASPSSARGRGVTEGEGGARSRDAQPPLPPLYIGALGGAG